MNYKNKFLVTIFSIVAICTFSGCEKNSNPGMTNCDPNCTTVQCSSNTQSGSQCKNMTKNCCGRCYLHK